MSSEVAVEFQPPGAFLKFLADNGFKRHRPVEDRGDFEVHYLDLTSLKLVAGHFVPFVVAKRLSGHKVLKSNVVEAVVDDMRSALHDVDTDFVVLVVGGRVPDFSEDLRVKLSSEQVAVLDGSTIEAVMPDKKQERKEDRREKHRRNCQLVHGLAASLGRRALSPYNPGTPVCGERFFGRTDALGEAMGNRRGGNVTIMGSRRIGKTSLLREIRRRMESQGADKVHIAEIYASTYQSTHEVLYAILRQIFRQAEAERHMQDPTIAQNFAQVLQSAAKDGKFRIAVFVDELDELLERDVRGGEDLMKVLRATFQGQDNCRIFFAGFRRVMADALRDKSELFNFTNKIHLRGLSRDETRVMVEEPLTLLGVDVHDDHVAMIYQETKGHPELVQMYCSELLAMTEKEGRPPDSNDLVKQVVNNDAFRQRIFGTFMANANPYEELLTYLLVSEMHTISHGVDDFVFSPPEVDKVLSKIDIELDVAEIEGLLTNLRMISITEKVDGTASTYRFAVPALVSYIESQDLRFLTRKALQRVKRNLGTPQALWAESDRR
ncbi:MAG TPA: ATP-binding protein [Bryobacteraceae bacterium]|nr:ATP-binding protein [Bryobacteraceae bacterium]